MQQAGDKISFVSYSFSVQVIFVSSVTKSSGSGQQTKQLVQVVVFVGSYSVCVCISICVGMTSRSARSSRLLARFRPT